MLEFLPGRSLARLLAALHTPAAGSLPSPHAPCHSYRDPGGDRKRPWLLLLHRQTVLTMGAWR